jgi:hypothetical protein
VTSLIHAIYSAANEAKDFRTMQFLDWFVKEQGEEEKNAEDLLKKFTLFGPGSQGTLYAGQRAEGPCLHGALSGDLIVFLQKCSASRKFPRRAFFRGTD